MHKAIGFLIVEIEIEAYIFIEKYNIIFNLDSWSYLKLIIQFHTSIYGFAID